jgi:APA family basic amino acid/polyamine antiporter
MAAAKATTSPTAQPKTADAEEPDGLRRELKLGGSIAMIVGIVIGSGIFLGVNRVAAGTGSVSLMLLVWVAAGLMTLMGALCYAELGTMMPKAGGEYVFLRKGMGSLPAFLSGWTAFTINMAGSAAALAIIFAEQLNTLKPEGFISFVSPAFSTKLTAAGLILLLSIVNYFGIKYGARVQSGFAILKGILIVGLAIAALTFAGNSVGAPANGLFGQNGVDGTPTVDGFSMAGFLGLAMVAALFAYDGWTNMVRIGSEVKDPQRNFPRASLIALLSIMGLYILISLGYLKVLGFDGFANGQSVGFANDGTVASNAASVIFGNAGASIVAALILVSVFGGLNGIILSGPRIYFAMARDKMFPRMFGQTNRHQAPANAIWVQAAIAIFFLMAFDFNQLTDNVVFVSFFFYGLTALGLILLRRSHPELERPYKVPLYPFLPIAYVVVAWTFVGYLLWDTFSNLSVDNIGRLAGLAIVALGLPVFFWYRKKLQKAGEEVGPLWGTDRKA